MVCAQKKEDAAARVAEKAAVEEAAVGDTEILADYSTSVAAKTTPGGTTAVGAEVSADYSTSVAAKTSPGGTTAVGAEVSADYSTAVAAKTSPGGTTAVQQLQQRRHQVAATNQKVGHSKHFLEQARDEQFLRTKAISLKDRSPKLMRIHKNK